MIGVIVRNCLIMLVILKQEKKILYGRPDDTFQEKFKSLPIELIDSEFAGYLTFWKSLRS